ncbi:MAG TPA: DNA topoisomerase I [Candidatus Nanoarchaeia archaeon]|nr:DNA topoisomerase I [Candidatus Nanoarchaeia archaeon]
MPYELIVSEKPSAAKRIAESLADGKPIKKTKGKVSYYEITHKGKDIVVACAVGHLYTVAEKKKSFKYPSFDLEWKPVADVDKKAAYSKQYLDVIKKLAKDADSFTVACDFDIEGEVIGLNIIRFICGQKDARRMKFSTTTKEDLVEAYQNVQSSLEWGQANAGETRHFLDWMYGINLTRALTLAIKDSGLFKILSAGRVQCPALKIVVDREHEIGAFKSVPFWVLELKVEKDRQVLLASHATDKFWDRTKAQSAYDQCLGKPAKVANIEQREVKQAPPFPFDLGSLQSEAYQAFGFSPKATLDIAQSLYVNGFTSYPRTSSQKLPASLNYSKILTGLGQQEKYKASVQILLSKKSLSPNEGKKTDPAHPAIYPTGVSPKGLKERDEKVYDLVVKRFLATFGEPAIRLTMKASLDVNTESFSVSGTKTKFKGWHELYEPYVGLKEEELPVLKVGEELAVKELNLLDKETQPPNRYNQASLVKELEKRNLGTKATRAEIVDNLFERKYVADQKIRATLIGMKTIETMAKYCPEILDEKLTQHFEEEMENIREKKHTKEQILKEAEGVLVKLLGKFKENQKKIGEELKDSLMETMDKENTLGPCKCGGTLKITFSKKSRKRFVACNKYPECTNTYPLPQNGFVTALDKFCPTCNILMISIRSKGKRPQEVCLNLDCPTKAIPQQSDEKRVCPKCSKDLILRKSIYGSFYGCSSFPKCRFIQKIPKPETEQPITAEVKE